MCFSALLPRIPLQHFHLLVRPFFKSVVCDMRFYGFHQVDVEMQIVDRSKRPAKRFLFLEQMAQIRTAVITAAIAIAVRVKWQIVLVRKFLALVAEHASARIN